MGKKNEHQISQLIQGKKNIITALLEGHDIESAEDIQATLRDLLGMYL